MQRNSLFLFNSDKQVCDQLIFSTKSMLVILNKYWKLNRTGSWRKIFAKIKVLIWRILNLFPNLKRQIFVFDLKRGRVHIFIRCCRIMARGRNVFFFFTLKPWGPWQPHLWLTTFCKTGPWTRYSNKNFLGGQSKKKRKHDDLRRWYGTSP